MANILVIDDDDNVLMFMKHSFEPLHRIHAYSNWSSAMAKASEGNIDLALVDYQLKGFQGNDIVRFLINLKLPRVYLFSASDPTELERIAKNCGAHGIVKKRLLLAPLSRKISELLGKNFRASLKSESGSFHRIVQPKSVAGHDQGRKREYRSAFRSTASSTNLKELVQSTRDLEREAFLERYQHFVLLQLNEYERVEANSTQITNPGHEKMDSVRLDPKKSAVYFIRGRLGTPSSQICTVGRSEDSDIVIPQELVSKYHAIIRQSPDGLTIEDSRSRNGTFLNATQLKRHTEVKLTRGSIVGFSKSLQFKLLSPQDLFVRVRMYRRVFQ